MPARSAVKRAAEVVERSLSSGQRANRHVDVEPEQRAFRIKIDAAPPRLPRPARPVEHLGRNRGVDQRPPGAADMLGHLRSIGSYLIAKFLRGQKSAAIREQLAEVVG